MKLTDRFVLFWDGWPSQWHRSEFLLDGVQYNCCEQFMMAEKARVFGDQNALARILAATSPRQQKALGRGVRNFDSQFWDQVCRGIVYTGNLAKFTQNDDLRETLLGTGSRVIVEASPKDRIWGIGLSPDDPDAQDPSKWQGRNWLGIAIMQVRDTVLRQAISGEAELDLELRNQLEARKRVQVATRE